jgi:hypothetical protein
MSAGLRTLPRGICQADRACDRVSDKPRGCALSAASNTIAAAPALLTVLKNYRPALVNDV